MAEENKDGGAGTGGDTSNETVRPEQPTQQERIDASLALQKDEREAALKPADIGAAGSAKGNMDASGAIMEPSVKSSVDVDHPAVDNNPRAGTTERQNAIDFNDPTLTEQEAVEQRLADQQG